jgi:hypothetical protein
MEAPRIGDICFDYGFVILNMHGKHLLRSPRDGSESMVVWRLSCRHFLLSLILEVKAQQ